MKNERLEKLSEKAKKGIPIGFYEALEVIAYQKDCQKKIKYSKEAYKLVIFFKRIFDYLKNLMKKDNL